MFEEIYRIKDGKCYFDVSQIMMRAKNRAYDHLKLGYNSLNFYNEWGIDKQVLTSVFIPIRSSLSKTKSLSPFRHLLHCYSNHVRQIEDPIKRIMKFSSLAYTAEQYDKKGEALLFLLEAIRNISNKNSVASQASLLMIYSMSERLNSPIISKEGYQKFVKNFLNLMSKLPYDHKNMDILDNLGSTLFDLGDKSLAVLIYKKHRELASQLTDLEIRNRYLYN
ncbi:hypothetical protein MJH12_05780 [bacterium]|nr:hypothetical protein [bacterium]